MEKEKDVKIERKKYYEKQLMLSCLILALSIALFIMTIGDGTLLSYLGFFIGAFLIISILEIIIIKNNA